MHYYNCGVNVGNNWPSSFSFIVSLTRGCDLMHSVVHCCVHLEHDSEISIVCSLVLTAMLLLNRLPFVVQYATAFPA